MAWGDRRTQRVPRPVLLQVEDYLQHGETLAILLVGDGFEEAAHGLLPALVNGVFVELVPGLVEIFGAQDQGQILTSAKDGIIAYTDFLQLVQQLRPDPLVFALVFLDRVRFDAQFECVPRHISSRRSWKPQPCSSGPDRR